MAQISQKFRFPKLTEISNFHQIFRFLTKF